MAYWLSGMDEAGYGPTLGPLVVGLTTLEAAEPIPPAAPWRHLAPTVVHRRSRSRRRSIAVADSKVLHRPASNDLSPLELGVLSFIAAERDGEPPATFRELVDHLTAGRSAYLDSYPWYRGEDLRLPLSVPGLALTGAIRRLRRRLEGAGLAVSEVRALPLEVEEFNSNLARNDDNKSAVNAWAIGRFLRWLWGNRSRRLADVWIDRLGGRQRYGPLLYPLFEGARFQIVAQEVENQEYRVEDSVRERSLGIHFNKDGEAGSFPTALASMTAKYLRELHMHLFNRWWRKHEPELHRTAGYVQDARRFLHDIAPLRRRLGVDDALLIRKR